MKQRENKTQNKETLKEINDKLVAVWDLGSFALERFCSWVDGWSRDAMSSAASPSPGLSSLRAVLGSGLLAGSPSRPGFVCSGPICFIFSRKCGKYVGDGKHHLQPAD